MSNPNDFETTEHIFIQNIEILEIDSINAVNLTTNLHDDLLVSNEERHKLKKKIGNLLTFFFMKSGQPLIVIGPNCKIKLI